MKSVSRSFATGIFSQSARRQRRGLRHKRERKVRVELKVAVVVFYGISMSSNFFFSSRLILSQGKSLKNNFINFLRMKKEKERKEKLSQRSSRLVR